MWALIRKEILENLRWLPLALLLTSSCMLAAVASGWLADSTSLTFNTLFSSSLLAIGFGLLQSIPDERNGARAYLLHRGVSASQVFWSKSIVGFGLVFVSVAIPLSACALWLGLRGVMDAPGQPIQVLPAATVAFTAFLFHPAIQLIIYRPARWLGSRVIPILVPLAMVIQCLQVVDLDIGLSTLAWELAGSLAVLLIVLLAARRAYVDLARLPAANSPAHRDLSVISVMAAGLFIFVVFVGIAVHTVKSAFQPVTGEFHNRFYNKSDGQVWAVKLRQKWSAAANEYQLDYISGTPMVVGVEPSLSGPIPPGFDPDELSEINPEYARYYESLDIGYRSTQGIAPNRWMTLVDRRGFVLCYERMVVPGNRLGQVISRDGVRNPKGDWGQPFDGVFGVDQYNRDLNLIGDKHGIYQLDETSGKLSTLIDMPVHSANVPVTVDGPLKLLVRSGPKVLVYQLADESGDLIQLKDQLFKKHGAITASKIAELDLPVHFTQYKLWSIHFHDSEDWVVHGREQGSMGGVVAQRKPGQELKVFTFPTPPQAYPFAMSDLTLFAWLSAPWPTLLGSLIDYQVHGRPREQTLAEVASVPAKQLPLVIAMFLLQGLIAACFTWYAAQRRGLSKRAQWIWSGLGLALGWTIPLAVLACHPRIVRETCTHCQKPRRVDLASCEHCHSTWEKLQREGVEIIEHEFDSALTKEDSRATVT